MRQYIGVLIRCENSRFANKKYINAIEKFGGRVVLIYDYENMDSLNKKLNLVKGILLTGGDDVGRLDFYLIKYAIDNDLKLFGICQGMQSMAIYNTSNKLISIGDDSHHKKSHYVVLKKDSIIGNILSTNKIKVNSYHFQTVFHSEVFQVVGYSEDLLIEVIENKNHFFQIGVQWHPEKMLDYDLYSNLLFRKFVVDNS